RTTRSASPSTTPTTPIWRGSVDARICNEREGRGPWSESRRRGGAGGDRLRWRGVVDGPRGPRRWRFGRQRGRERRRGGRERRRRWRGCRRRGRIRRRDDRWRGGRERRRR